MLLVGVTVNHLPPGQTISSGCSQELAINLYFHSAEIRRDIWYALLNMDTSDGGGMNKNLISISCMVSAVAGWKFGPKHLWTWVAVTNRWRDQWKCNHYWGTAAWYQKHVDIDYYIETNAKAPSILSFWMINQCSIAGFLNQYFAKMKP